MAGSPDTLSASWTEPDPANGIISGYTINCTTPTGEMLQPFNIGPGETSAMLDGLVAYTNYTCIISATTGAGEGQFSTPLTVTTVEDGMYVCRG